MKLSERSVRIKSLLSDVDMSAVTLELIELELQEYIEIIADLHEDLEISENSVKVLEEGLCVLEARLRKVYDYLEKEGLTVKEANGIMKLDCENY